MSIQLKHIHKQFNQNVGLHDISLEFNKGELIALLGPSGCGKTTLLRIIAGLEQADSGEIWLDGEDASQHKIHQRQVGFVFQHYALFRHMTIFDNVAFGMRMKPRHERLTESAISKKVHELLNLVQLDWLSDRFPSQLSGGQRQRIALARALAVQPRILLLDEPFGALDAKVRKELRRWLRHLHEELEVTSIFVTHDQEEALEVADRVVLMNHGRVEQVGTPQAIYTHPQTPFVHSFLGNSNFFQGRIESGAVYVGSEMLAQANDEWEDGSSVLAFTRPHELNISTNMQAQEGISAKITRIWPMGMLTQVELEGLHSASGQHFEVSLSQEKTHHIQLHENQEVRLIPSRLTLFPQEVPLS